MFGSRPRSGEYTFTHAHPEGYAVSYVWESVHGMEPRWTAYLIAKDRLREVLEFDDEWPKAVIEHFGLEKSMRDLAYPEFVNTSPHDFMVIRRADELKFKLEKRDPRSMPGFPGAGRRASEVL